MKSPYFDGRTIILTTKHHKELVIRPLIEKQLGLKVIVESSLDTDTLGTFTRDIRRQGSQLESARSKAQLGMKHHQESLGIANEGAFDIHPQYPFVLSDIEIITLIDQKNNIEITGHSITPDIQGPSGYTKSVEEARQIAKKLLFPSHGVILRSSPTSNHVIKDIALDEDLVKAFEKISGIWRKRVFIEPDRRAHRNPTRMQNIATATQNLIGTALSLCPKCDCPGFRVIESPRGLPCSRCRTPTDMIDHLIFGCQKCKYHERRERSDGLKLANPGQCGYCNP